MKRIAAVAALFLLAGAQAAIIVDTSESIIVAPGGTATIPFTVTGDCQGAVGPSLADILAGSGSVSVPVTASGGEGLTFSSESVDLDYTSCITGVDPTNPGLPALTATGAITVTADQWAPGRNDQPITLTAGEDTTSANVMVNYTNLFAMTTDATFPLETKDGKATFNVTVDLTTNARTMIMFFNDDAACGSITGLPPVTNVNDGDFVVGEPMQIVWEITYTNNCSDNDSDMHKFHALAHFQDKQFGDETRHPFEWSFTNEGTHSESGEGSEETPGFGALFAALGLVGIAFVARRK